MSPDVMLLIEQLKNNNWNVSPQRPADFFLSSEITSRYSNIPTPFLTFLSQVSECVNPDNSAWFLLASNFNRTSSYAMSWDYIEALDSDSAMGDEKLIAEIDAFWDRHIPIMHGVRSDISFVAICLSEECYGTIVHSFSPNFQEASTIADSFPQFLEMLANAAQGIDTGVDPNLAWVLEDLV
ncbi:MAG: hypothetical protein JWQ02_2750 [Capsulimonas sp.]|nr:hypothetical protein [Capsulimonas sp.]